MRVTIDLDAEVIEHLIGGTCEAGVFKPCGLSEIVMQRVYEAVIGEPGVYVQDVPAERMTGDSVVVEPNAAAEGDTR